MLICDDGTDDGVEEETLRLKPAQIPTSPPGWLLFWHLPSIVTDRRDIGIWMLAVDRCQTWDRDFGRRRRRVVRDHGGRHLVIHPDLRQRAEEELGEWMRSLEGCNCAGFDCLLGRETSDAFRVMARRLWPKIPISTRIALIKATDTFVPNMTGAALLKDPFDLQGGDDLVEQVMREQTGDSDAAMFFVPNMTGAA